MTCGTFKELRRQLKGITRIDYTRFAEVLLNISSDTYLRWSQDEDKMRHSPSRNSFYEMMKRSYKEFNQAVENARITDPSINNVSEEEWLRAQEHYDHWRTHTGPSLEDSDQPVPHFATISVIVKLLRWQNRETATNPLYCKAIGTSAIGIHDEAIVYRQATLGRIGCATVHARNASSGIIEPIDIFRIPDESRANSVVLPHIVNRRAFHVGPSQKQILYGTKTFNGFQRDNEKVSAMMFENTTADQISLTMDFESVIDATPFTKKPEAVYVGQDDNCDEIQCHRSSGAEIWHSTYDEPEPFSQIILSWSMI